MRRVPSDAEWQRLTVAFGGFFAATIAVALLFITISPFPTIVGLVLMGPPVAVTGWIWIVVIRPRDAERLSRLTALAARRRSRRRYRRRFW